MKLLYNPFEKLTEVQLISLGIVFLALGSFLGYYFDARFDGVLDMHTGPSEVTIEQPFIDNIINTFTLFIVLYILGLIVNTKTRLVDIFAVSIIARSPLYLSTLINAGGFLDNIEKNLDPSHPESIQFGAFDVFMILLMLPFILGTLVWFIALLYNGFKTATNIKYTGHKVAFGFSILIAEVISKLIIGYTNY
ncbi:hypothetical protein FMM05_09215 [Flavobacterium zepuense]|uniref:Yip1 domain-containing protein n=1 Tax=Flavobacterium zepuense TaxID=2593302 RepID=A0A552V2J5_9FLAO|nr:hypothetical protein [Flavobacterium zepuense]TRW24679.1 hypothetical protein FMM05_09215 [Flavobacterium zepuense]